MADRRLEARRISVRFGEVHALDGVDLSLAPSRILGLIGPNGSGKSTCINVLSGFVAPTSGDVFHNDRRMTGDAPDDRARRGVVRTFQSVRLFPRLTVAENLEVAAMAAGDRRAAARSLSAEIMDFLGLAPLAGSPARVIPYGAERRVGIGRALALRPEFLLLDEPAAGLDERETDELAQSLLAICSTKGCGLLVVEHDMRLIGEICHDALVLSGGTMLAKGEPAAVMRDPRVIEAYLGTREVSLDA